MFHIRVEKWLSKDIHSVFDVISDHENYKQFSGVDDSVLLEPGEQEKNGQGALRQITSGRIILFERITAFERPHKMFYQIEKATPIPLDHRLGQIHLCEENGGTRVVWKSTGTMQVPVIGALVLDRLIQKQVSRQFASMLKAIDER